MNADRLKSYRFSTEAQWNACLFVQADRDSRQVSGGIRPFPPYGRPGTLYKSQGAYAPVITRLRELLWRDGPGCIHRLPLCNDEPDIYTAPPAIAVAKRIVAAANGFWVISEPPNSLEYYEEDTLTRLLTVDITAGQVVDIAGGGHDSVLALVRQKDGWQSLRIDRWGEVVETIDFKGISNAVAFAYLSRLKRFVVLAGDLLRSCEPEMRNYQRLYWFSAKGGNTIFSLPVAAMRPCFEAHALASDSRDRVFLAGTEGDEFGGAAYVVIFDADGNLLGDLPLDPLDVPATGIAASRDALLLTGPRGLTRFDVATVVPEGAQSQCMLMTPVLFSPDREDQRRWLRVEATTSLPEGSTLEISWSATDDPPKQASSFLMDDSIPASKLVATVLNEPDQRRGRVVFHGANDSAGQSTPKGYAAPLFDVRERYLRVCVTLTAAAGAGLPSLSELAVFYPGRTLMEDLPSIYQREEDRPNSFLRSLVGVLETTTQGLDASIGAMGSKINPDTAPEPWLDFIARWLGVPWDDGLSVEQKRAIVNQSSELAKGRGTRAGLEAFLEALIPGSPKRYRVTDATADFGFAMVGGNSCAGSALPAMLGGYTRWRSELDVCAVLDHTRLPCAGQLDDGVWQIAGTVRVEVVATAIERKAWEPWLPSLIKEMVPLTARVELRWVIAQTLRTNRLDGTMKLESAPAPHLGNDAITSLARLPQRGVRLSDPGATVGTRLR
jgi:phage tail-like protein